MDRLDRVRDGAGGGGWYIPGGGGSPWPIHKERQPEQRSVDLHCDQWHRQGEKGEASP